MYIRAYVRTYISKYIGMYVCMYVSMKTTCSLINGNRRQRLDVTDLIGEPEKSTEPHYCPLVSLRQV